MSAVTIKFNNYTLQNSTYFTRNIKHSDIPERDILIESRSRQDGTIIVNARFKTKIITVNGYISASSQTDLDNKIDELKQNLQLSLEGDLDISFAGTTRRYFAAVKDIRINDDFYNIDNVPYEVDFICSNPFGYLTTSGVVNVQNVTTVPYNLIITMSGNYIAKPAIQITLNVGSDNITMFTIESVERKEKLVIAHPTGSFSNGDIILVNSQNLTCQLNGSGIDYTGVFPFLDIPTTTLRFIDNGTSRDYSIITQYLPTYT